MDRLGREIPDGMVIVASCGNGLCVNPDHFVTKTWGIINNARRKNFTCSVGGCDRKAVKNEMCQLHYGRVRNGKSLTGSVRVIDPGRPCRVSGCRGVHYGEGFCRSHYGKIRQARTKLELIEAMGGRCEDCGKIHHYSAFDFHHLDPSQKEGSVSYLTTVSPEAAKREASKCILLCANCHRQRHCDKSIDSFLEGNGADVSRKFSKVFSGNAGVRGRFLRSQI